MIVHNTISSVLLQNHDTNRDILVYPRINTNDYVQLLYKNVRQEYRICNLVDLTLNGLNLKKQILHINWLSITNINSFFKVSFLLLYLVFCRFILRKRIYWTPHNLIPHESKSKLNVLSYNVMFRLAHVIMAHGNYEKRSILQRFARKAVVLKHPNYEIPKNTSKNNTFHFDKEYLHFIMFGQIRDYKGVEEILKIWNVEWGRLIVAGKNKLSKELPEIDGVVYYDQFLEFSDLCDLIRQCDYALFNYKQITMSGSLVLAKNLGVKIITKSIGNLPEYLSEDDIEFHTEDELKYVISTLAGLN